MKNNNTIPAEESPFQKKDWISWVTFYDGTFNVGLYFPKKNPDPSQKS